METVRFEKFITLLEGIRKNIGRMKEDFVPEFGVKSVHIMWLYRLSMHENGLTSAELAAVSTVDRSLVSREISSLKKNGYIETLNAGSKRGYKARWCLTDKGRATAVKIREMALKIQERVGEGIDPVKLASFYETLEHIHGNFAKLATSEEI